MPNLKLAFMNKTIKCSLLALLLVSLSVGSSKAGNEDRTGEAGAVQLLINPWARSSAWGFGGLSSVDGIESSFLNIAGLAFVDKTEILASTSNWLGNAGVRVNSFGLGQRLGETGVLGISLMSVSFGDIQITRTNAPEGGIGNFTPSNFNLGLAYAKRFSESISAGINAKIISEALTNVSAIGVAFDAGIRYATGDRDQTKIAISLKNVGTPMRFTGDGLDENISNSITSLTATRSRNAAAFELPSLLSIGASYNFLLSESSNLTLGGAFVANAFRRDQVSVGLEYHIKFDKAHFKARTGYVYEPGMFAEDARSATALNGPSGGLSLDLPVGKSKESTISLDYGARLSTAFGITHSLGLRINVK